MQQAILIIAVIALFLTAGAINPNLDANIAKCAKTHSKDWCRVKMTE